METNSMKFESDNENNETICLSESKGLSLSDITQATIGNLHEWADNSDQKLESGETASQPWEDVSDSENTDYLLESDDSNKTEKNQPPPTYQEHLKRQLDDDEEDVRSKRQRINLPAIHQIPAAINTFYQTNREMCNDQNIATSSLLKNIQSIESNLESNLGNDRNADKVGSAKGSPNVTSKALNILPLNALFPGPKSLAARSTNSPTHQQHTAAMQSTDSPLHLGQTLSTTVAKNSPLPTHHSSKMPESNSPIHGFYSSAMMASNFPFREGQGQFFNKTQQQQQQQQTVVSSSHNSNLNSIQQSYLPWANSPMVLNQTKTEKTIQQSYVSPIVHQGIQHVQAANQPHGLQNGIQNGIQFQQSFITHQTQTIQPQLFQPYILQPLNEPIPQSSHLQQLYGMPVFHQPPLYVQPHQAIADRKPNFHVNSLMQNMAPIESPKPSFPSPNPGQNMISESSKPNFQPNHAMQSMAIQSSTMYGERTSDAQTSTHLMPKLIKTVSETSQTDALFNLKNLQAAIGCDETSGNSNFNYGLKEEPKTPIGKHTNTGSSMYDSPGMDSRFTESLYNLLGSPPPDSPRSKNPILGDLQAVLNRECKKEIVPQSLFGMQTYNNENETKKKLNVFDRERLIQEKFTALKEKNPEEVRQLSSMFRYQSALIETDRFRTLHESQYPGSYKDSVNQHFDDKLHQVMERVERSIELLDKSNKENYRSRDRQSRPHLSKESVRLMETWYEQNLTHPYPTTHVIEMLAQAGNIGVEQVKKWFANKRNRSSNTRTRTEIAMQKRRLNLMKQQTTEQF